MVKCISSTGTVDLRLNDDVVILIIGRRVLIAGSEKTPEHQTGIIRNARQPRSLGHHPPPEVVALG